MPKVLQFRRASTATIAATLGALGEVFYNTDTKTLATFDGTTTGGTALATAASVSSTSSILSTIINNQSSTLVGYINAQDSSISSTLTVNYTAADSSQSSILTTNYKAADSSLNATINFVSSTLYTGYTSSIGNVSSVITTNYKAVDASISSNLNTLSSNTWRTATSSTQGLITLASDAQAQAQTNDGVGVTPYTLAQALKSGNQSLTTDGYQKLPGGLIIQWGTTGTITGPGTAPVTFPINFPSACANIQLTIKDASGDTSSTGIPAARSVTSAGFILYNGEDPNMIFNWLAIGY